MNNKTGLVLLFLQILSAVIMGQTLFFKFSGSEESVLIFSSIGMEPWGRYIVGVLELGAAILLLTKSHSWLGALAGVGLMAGAIMMHFLFIGIEVMNDGGYLFGLAVFVFVSCSIVVWYRKKEVPILKKYF